MLAGQEMCCGAQEVALKLLPLHDFVALDLSQVLVEPFVGFKIQESGNPVLKCTVSKWWFSKRLEYTQIDSNRLQWTKID